jgi:hypothetical protein
MRAEYDFSQGKKNPYAKKLKQRISIDIDKSTMEYFENRSKNMGIPYQTLIHLYLMDCAKEDRVSQISFGT